VKQHSLSNTIGNWSTPLPPLPFAAAAWFHQPRGILRVPCVLPGSSSTLEKIQDVWADKEKLLGSHFAAPVCYFLSFASSRKASAVLELCYRVPKGWIWAILATGLLGICICQAWGILAVLGARWLSGLKVVPVAAVEKGLGTDGSYGSGCQGCGNSKSIAVTWGFFWADPVEDSRSSPPSQNPVRAGH